MGFFESFDCTRHAARCASIALAALLLPLLAFPGTVRAQNDLATLGDEFEHSESLGQWTRLHVAEQWNAEQLDLWDVDGLHPGAMTMRPHTVTWFQDYVGPYAFKTVSGDFVITTDATVTGRDGSSVPQSLFSLGGLMVRRPRNVTPATWSPGGEGYVFLSVGYGNAMPRRFQFEVKTTVNSVSNLVLSDAPGANAGLQIARLGNYVVTLRREPGHPWVVHRRYTRTDLPETLQAGLVSYTDWGKVQYFAPYTHNQTALDPPLPPGVTDPRPDVPFTPDVLARFAYARFFRPTIPPALAGRDLSDPSQVSDAELLAFLGENANEPAPDPAGASAALARPRLDLGAAPNPFRNGLTIRLALATRSNVRVAAFDLAGRAMREVFRGVLDPGSFRFEWDGRDAHGAACAPGLYLLRAETGSDQAAARVVRTR
jgi:hypothetical protein